MAFRGSNVFDDTDPTKKLVTTNTLESWGVSPVVIPEIIQQDSEQLSPNSMAAPIPLSGNVPRL